jgi:hypothetical protein
MHVHTFVFFFVLVVIRVRVGEIREGFLILKTLSLAFEFAYDLKLLQVLLLQLHDVGHAA